MILNNLIMETFSNHDFRFENGEFYDKNCNDKNKTHTIVFMLKSTSNEKNIKCRYLCFDVNINYEKMSNDCTDIVSEIKSLGYDEKQSIYIHFENNRFNENPVNEGVLDVLKNKSIVFCKKILTKDINDLWHSYKPNTMSLYQIYIDSLYGQMNNSDTE